MNVIKPCSICGKWHFTNSMVYTRNGKRVNYYCDDCLIKYNKHFNGGKSNEENREQRI